MKPFANNTLSEKSQLIVSLTIKALFLAAIALALIALLDQFSLAVIPKLIRWEFALLLLPLQLITVYMAALCWKTLLSATTPIKITYIEAISQIGLVLVGKYIPGKVWGSLLKIWILRKKTQDAAPLLGVIGLEQIIVLHSALIIGATFYLLDNWLLACLALLLGLTTIMLLVPLLEWGTKLVCSMIPPITEKLTAAVSISKQANLKQLLLIYLLNIISWAISGLVVAALALTIGVELNWQQTLAISGATVISIFVGFLAFFSPGGIGVREATFIGLMGASIGYDVSATLAILHRVWLIMIDGLWGIFSYLYCKSNGDL